MSLSGVGALIGAGSSLFSALSNIGAGKRNYERQKQLMEQQQQYNRENMETQYGYTEDMWRKTNEYNSPANAVRRLREAGLSPTLAYGSGSLSGLSHMGSTPQSSNPSVAGPPIDSLSAVGSAMANFGEQMARIKLLNSQAEGQDIDNSNKQKSYDLDFSYRDATTRLVEQQVINEKQRESLLSIEQKTNQLALDFSKSSYDVNLKMAYRNFDRLNEEIESIQVSRGKVIADTDVAREELNSMRVQQMATIIDSILTRSLTKESDARTRKLAIENGILSATADDQITISHLNREILSIDKSMKDFVSEHQDLDWDRLNYGEYVDMITKIANSGNDILKTFLNQSNHDKDSESRFRESIRSMVGQVMMFYLFRK